jgi:hypothetical protein
VKWRETSMSYPLLRLNPLPPLLGLSSIMSDVEADLDLLEKQNLTLPREVNLITSTKWIPIATSDISEKKREKRKISLNSSFLFNSHCETLARMLKSHCVALARSLFLSYLTRLANKEEKCC